MKGTKAQLKHFRRRSAEIDQWTCAPFIEGMEKAAKAVDDLAKKLKEEHDHRRDAAVAVE